MILYDATMPTKVCAEHKVRACPLCYQRSTRARRKSLGLCTTCGEKSLDFSRCAKCRKRAVERIHYPRPCNAPQACSFCGEGGHNRASCKKRLEAAKRKVRSLIT